MALAKLSYPPAPFTAPVSGDIDQKLAQIVQMINSKADRNVPAFPFFGLIDPSGATWKVTIDTSGVIHTELAPVRG